MSSINLQGSNPSPKDVINIGAGGYTALPAAENGLYLSRQSWTAAQAHALSHTAVHAAVTDNAALQTVTTAITNPPCARNISATAGGTGANITAVSVIVTGTDIAGQAITETLPAFTAATPGTVVGNLAFATVASIAIPANGSGVTTAIGYDNKLGLAQYLNFNTVGGDAALAQVREGTAPTVASSTTTLAANTVILNSALNGTAVQVIYVPHFDQTLVG